MVRYDRMGNRLRECKWHSDLYMTIRILIRSAGRG